MRAFHGSENIKGVYLARVAAHRAADELIKGRYWENGKGCAVGCTIHSSDHGAYERELGIPRELARLEDRIFESLPNDLAMQWPERFLAAIKPGADLARVSDQFLLWLLSDAEHGTLRLCRGEGIAATKRVICLFEQKLSGDVIDRETWIEAGRAAYADAYADAYAAAYAAYAAAAYAAGAYADAAAYAAAYAADADADAAASAAYAAAAYAAGAYADAARQAHFVRMADKLVQLLEAAP